MVAEAATEATAMVVMAAEEDIEDRAAKATAAIEVRVVAAACAEDVREGGAKFAAFAPTSH